MLGLVINFVKRMNFGISYYSTHFVIWRDCNQTPGSPSPSSLCNCWKGSLSYNTTSTKTKLFNSHQCTPWYHPGDTTPMWHFASFQKVESHEFLKYGCPNLWWHIPAGSIPFDSSKCFMNLFFKHIKRYTSSPSCQSILGLILSDKTSWIELKNAVSSTKLTDLDKNFLCIWTTSFDVNVPWSVVICASCVILGVCVNFQHKRPNFFCKL